MTIVKILDPFLQLQWLPYETFLLLHVTKPEMYTSFKAIKIPFDVVVKLPYESFFAPKQTLPLFSSTYRLSKVLATVHFNKLKAFVLGGTQRHFFFSLGPSDSFRLQNFFPLGPAT